MVSNVRAVFTAYMLHRQAGTPGFRRETYGGGEHWITIGGSQQGNKRHAGGTPVKVDAAGRIVAGPAALKDRHLADIAPSGGGGKRRKESAPGQMHFFGWGTAPGSRSREGETARQAFFDFSDPPERHPLPPTVRRLPDGRAVGHAVLSPDDLAVDPDRFQYKVSEIVDAATGTGAELKEVRRFRPEFAGQLLVWRDPENGTNYVVNGHHRFELARRSGYKGGLPVYFIDARTASEARAMGALANIAEGRGTALDAAKYMRESGLGPDDLREQGISLRGEIARKGAVLRHLTPHLFNELALGRLSEAHALAVAAHLHDLPDMQEQLFREIEKKGRFSVEDLEEVAREMRSTAKSEKQQTLFGEEEVTRSYIWEKAAIKNALRRRLAERLRAFSTVAQERKAEFLQEAGNVIDREANERITQRLAEAQFMFDIEANMQSDFSRQLNRWAEEVADRPKRKNAIIEEAWEFAQNYFGIAAPSGKEAGKGEAEAGLF